MRLSEAADDAILTGAAAAPFRDAYHERLLRRRVLVELPHPSVWEVCANCTCGAPYREIVEVNGSVRAACPINAGADVVFEPEDLETWRIEVKELAAEIAHLAGFGDDAEEVAEGLWSLGVSNGGSAVLLAFTARAATEPHVPHIARSLQSVHPTILLCPRLPAPDLIRLRDAGVLIHEIGELFTQDTIRESLKMIERLPAPPEDGERLVFNAARGEVRVFGLTIILPITPARLMRLLVDAAGTSDPVLSHRAIFAEFGREERDVVRELRDALVDGGMTRKQAHALVKNARNRGWRLDIAKERIVVVD